MTTEKQMQKFINNGIEYYVPGDRFPSGGTTGQVLTITSGERDTQGPCSDGYHVPTQAEWEAVYDAGVALGQWSSNNGDDMRIKLKLPFAGERGYILSQLGMQGTYGYYWSSTAYTATNSYIVQFTSTLVSATYYAHRSYGKSIRPFKNFPLKPSASWTTIYAGSNGAGIYHNASEGAISISSDGTTRYTIADKNLGATQVYNDGDDLSEANCGKYYQWGNNYGFSWTGTVTTSDTKINASSYGPGNYYNSSIFITTATSPYDRSSVQNDNLWGGVTKLKPKKKTEWKDSKGGIQSDTVDGIWAGSESDYESEEKKASNLYFVY